jgi:hypothetical protein
MDRCFGLGDGEFAAVVADQDAVGGFVGEVDEMSTHRNDEGNSPLVETDDMLRAIPVNSNWH